MNLPSITIDLVPLTAGEVLTIHVALNQLAIDLRANGLGDDEHGKAMTTAYLDNIQSIQRVFCARCAREVKQ